MIERSLRYFALAVSALLIAATAYTLYLIPSRIDPQVRGPGSCFSRALPSIPNANGLIVSSYESVCDDFSLSSAVYVYLHRPGEQDDSGSLILRYANRPPDSNLPKIRWIDDKSLSISVNEAILVTKILNSSHGIRISYSIVKEDFPRDDWNKTVFTFRIFESADLFLLILSSLSFSYTLYSLGKEIWKRTTDK